MCVKNIEHFHSKQKFEKGSKTCSECLKKIIKKIHTIISLESN